MKQRLEHRSNEWFHFVDLRKASSLLDGSKSPRNAPEESPKAIENGSKTSLRAVCRGSLCCMEWDAVSMELFDRFGRYLGGRGMEAQSFSRPFEGLRAPCEAFEQRLSQLEDFVELHGHLPRARPKDPKEDETCLAGPGWTRIAPFIIILKT